VLRLGELLVAGHVLEPGKVEQALRAQVVWGGRLGTNLIELGFIDLDELSRALGRQHALPAALARHFDRANPELQAALPAELAERYGCVPLLHLADGKIALAAMDPIEDAGLAELATAFGVEPTELVVSIAAEQRVLYQLERVYQIARGARYLRTRGGTIPPFPVFGDFQDEADSEVELPVDAPPREDDSMAVPMATDGDDDPTTSFAVARTHSDALAAAIDTAIDTAIAGSSEPEVARGRDRRTYVKTLGDGGEDRAAPRPRPREPSRPKKALGRIAIKRAAVPNAPTAAGVPIMANLPDAAIEARGIDDGSEQPVPESLADAAKHVRRSPDRDRVAELVIDALLRFAPAADATMLFVIRGGSAIGWRSFCRAEPGTEATEGNDGTDGIGPAELAVPMDQPGLLPQAVSLGKTCRAGTVALGDLDAQLLAELAPPRAGAGSGGSRELAVVPIAIAGKVMCVLAVATAAGASLAAVETIAAAAGTAFGRLMRDAGR
jgi:hypothetical protein